MGSVPPEIPSAGVFLSLLTESFAVRAFLGSLVAAGLAAAALHWRWVNTPRARRLVVLAPILASVAAAVASVLEAETYLPQLWIASSGGRPGQVFELLGELRVISNARGVDVLFLAWSIAVTVLLTRRVWGGFVTRRMVASASPAPVDTGLQRAADALADAMGSRRAAVRLLDGCPGGAFASGVRRPIIVVDLGFVRMLDAQEVEGLLAHEIAHVARRDALLSLLVGVVSDLTFFLPTVHLVRRWLTKEREESADEWASQHTRRPAALASGILKVWERALPRVPALQVCGAVPASSAPPRRGLARLQRRPHLSGGARSVALRVERLVTPAPASTTARQMLEVSLAAIVIVVALAAALAIPPWIAHELDAYSLAIAYVPPPADPVESAAFSTFRALAPSTDAGLELRGFERTLGNRTSFASRAPGCPCVETQAEWTAGVPAAVPSDAAGMAWRRTAQPTWDVTPGPGSLKARPLLTLSDSGPQLGFFVVAEQ